MKPYDFSASFAPSSFEVELQPGVNLFRLVAVNGYGLSGFAEQSIEVLVTPPADQTYEYEIAVQEDPYTKPYPDLTLRLRTRFAGGAWGAWRTLNRDDYDTFSEAAGGVLAAVVDLHLSQPMNGDGADDEMWATVTDLGTENKGEVLKITLDRSEVDPQVGEQVVWRGEWTREEHDLENLARHDLALGASSAITSSTGGSFHPIVIGVDGPAGLFDKLTIGDAEYHLVDHDGKLLLALPGGTVPRALLSTANLSGLTTAPQTPNDEPAGMKAIDAQAKGDGTDFALGVGAGLLWTIPDNLVGLWDGVKFLGSQAIQNHPVPMMVRWIKTGDPRTVEDQRRWQTAKGVALKLAQVVQKINQDQAAFIYALQTGDDATLNALGEEYQVALEFAAEMLDVLWADIAAKPKYEQGKIVGRIVGEVVLTVATSLATGGGALVAKGAAMAGVATKLKQVAFLQRFAGKFDDLIVFYNRVKNTTMCFVAGTLVLTKEGLKPIEQVRSGDLVLSRDPSSNSQGYRRVVSTVVTHPDRLYHMTYRAPDGEARTLVGTGEHPFYVVGRETFVPVKELAVGDEFRLANGQFAQLVSIDTEDAPPGETFTTYNFEVEGWHTYFVGEVGVWVHNDGDTCQRVASIIYRIQEKDGLDEWRAFERFLEKTDTPARRGAVGTHLILAAHETMKESYKKAAALARQGDIDGALDLVPKHSRVKQVMDARRAKSSIDSHHTATKEWAEHLLRNTGRPEYQNLTPAQWNEVLDDMPAYLMDLAFHREGGSTVPKVRDLTAVIREQMAGTNPRNSQSVLENLEEAYDVWDAQLGGDPTYNLGDDIWVVARAWLKKKGVQ